ncbi:MAG: HAD-IA family hydrolase [candidate division KSB1 bacterium]|jgi:HAD superfamily phosphatase|nr:HAD-IA family hydrolase [candidate division KSB1 bacterium]
MIRPGAILFDMDGVLVDVSASYRVAIQRTVVHFSGKEICFDTISGYKNRGGLNNDWDLTGAVLKELGLYVARQEIIDRFQSYYLGENDNGLINDEEWLPEKQLLARLEKDYALGIVTGRPRAEAEYVLKRNHAASYFSVLIAMEDTPVERGKPHPDGILLALDHLNVRSAVYLGDTIDDIMAAKAAGIMPVGVLTGHVSRDNQSQLFRTHGAVHTLNSVNEIAEILHETF